MIPARSTLVHTHLEQFHERNVAPRAALKSKRSYSMPLGILLGLPSRYLVLTIEESTYKDAIPLSRTILEALHKAQEDKASFDFIRRIPVTSDGGVHRRSSRSCSRYSFSAYVAEVEVDVETGLIKCTDVGCSRPVKP